jgi:hypothetical protein
MWRLDLDSVVIDRHSILAQDRSTWDWLEIFPRTGGHEHEGEPSRHREERTPREEDWELVIEDEDRGNDQNQQPAKGQQHGSWNRSFHRRCREVTEEGFVVAKLEREREFEGIHSHFAGEMLAHRSGGTDRFPFPFPFPRDSGAEEERERGVAPN